MVEKALSTRVNAVGNGPKYGGWIYMYEYVHNWALFYWNDSWVAGIIGLGSMLSAIERSWVRGGTVRCDGISGLGLPRTHC